MDNETVANDDKKVKKRKRLIPKAVRPEEFKDLIKSVLEKDKIAKISFLLAYGSGLRISEVVNLQPDDFKENSLFISESKYGVERFVPIPKGWKSEFTKTLPLYDLTKIKEKSAIRTLERKFKKYSKKAGLDPKYTFHSLRHGFATRALEGGIPLNQIQMLLGHSNISTTSVYVKANPKDALKSYEELF